MNLRLDSNIFLVLQSEENYIMHEVYNSGHKYGGELRSYNNVNYTNGYLSNGELSTYELRKNLSALNFKVAFVVSRYIHIYK